MHTSSRPSTQAELSPRSGKTLTAVWAMRNVRKTLTPTERHVLHAFFSFMGADAVASPGHAALVRETGYVKRTIISAIEALVSAGLLIVIAESQLLPVKRCAVYKVAIELITQEGDTGRDLGSPEHSQGDRSSGIVIHDHVSVNDDHENDQNRDLGSPFEDLGEDEKRIIEDSSLPLTTSQAPSPATSRSPVVPPIATAHKARKRATRPKVEPLAYEALTTQEREVHDFIVGDALLVQICQAVPQLSRDLIVNASINGVVVIDVIRELRKAVQWNRDPSTRHPWKTTGGGAGLRRWIDGAMDRRPVGHDPMPSRPNADLGNSYLNQDTPAPPKREPVDLGKNPELMGPKLYKAARFV